MNDGITLSTFEIFKMFPHALGSRKFIGSIIPYLSGVRHELSLKP